MSSSSCEEAEEEEEDEEERLNGLSGVKALGEEALREEAARLDESTTILPSLILFSHQCRPRLRMRRRTALNRVPPDPTMASLTDLDQILISFSLRKFMIMQ